MARRRMQCDYVRSSYDIDTNVFYVIFVRSRLKNVVGLEPYAIG